MVLERQGKGRAVPGLAIPGAPASERIEGCIPFEDLAEEALFLAAARGGAGEEVEHAAVLEAVEGHPHQEGVKSTRHAHLLKIEGAASLRRGAGSRSGGAVSLRRGAGMA